MYQQVIIVGNLGSDPEMRFTPSGVPVTSFSVAVNRRWTDSNGEPREKTTWFRVTAWRRLAELCNQYLSKGRLVLVEGEVDASAWLDNQGNPRATLELTARKVQFLGGRGDKGTTPSAPGEGEEFISDDMPF
ncbi:MAG: single-stranded DNA-binding protein [Chloroflexi bacterium]|nr:single-stranded DNA-binding protein [Chloroflexota bacterium]